jgi:hypothetical protein
MGKPTFDS